MVAHCTHDHPLCREDSSMLFEILDEIFRNTPFCSSLKPHQDKRDSRNAHLTIISHCAGEDKWEKELKKNEDFLKERVWTGWSNYPLKKFIGQCRNAFHVIVLCSEHVSYQLPNEET